MKVIAYCFFCFIVLGCGESEKARTLREQSERTKLQEKRVGYLEEKYDQGIETNAVLAELTQLAEAGNSKAQGVLSAKLCDRNDFEGAKFWATKAADQGDGRGMNTLGVLYSRGQGGCQRLPAKVFEWFKKASKAGCARGYFNLGVVYRDGEGCEKSLTRAFEHFLKSAELGYAPGCFEVGLCYCLGRGTNVSMQEGVRWLKEAVKHGSREGRVPLAIIYATGNTEIAQDMEQAALLLKDESAEVLAKKIKQHTLYKIGSYLNERGDEKQERRFWTALSISNPENPDLRWYGRLSILTMDFNSKKDARREVFAKLVGMALNTTNRQELSAVSGVVASIYSTAEHFVDKNAAAIWFERAALAGGRKAVENLIEFRKGYIDDFPEFMKQEPSCVSTNNDVNFCIGHGLAHGICFEKNGDMALPWLVAAARRGSVEAYLDLREMWDRKGGRIVESDKIACSNNVEFCLRQAALLSGQDPGTYRINVTKMKEIADGRCREILPTVFGKVFDVKYLLPRVEEWNNGVRDVYDSAVIGFDSKDIPFDRLFESRRDGDLGDANNCESLFGVEFGGVVPKGIKPSYMSDDGCPVYKFTPKKSFRKFSNYTFTATPTSRRIFEVHANSLEYNLEGSVDAEQKLVMGLLEEKYGRKDIHYNWDLCRGIEGVDASDHGLLFFGPSRFGSPKRARRFIEVFLGESKWAGCKAVGITAVDFEIRKVAMEELKKKSCHDVDAL